MLETLSIRPCYTLERFYAYHTLLQSNQMRNVDATVRDLLRNFPSVSSIEMQASAMAHLTQGINQLTMSTSV